MELVENIRDGIEMLRAALVLSREAQAALPKGEQADAVGRALDDAEKKARLAEAQIAKGLDYKLCRCTFPPEIMLFTGVDDKATSLDHARIFTCPRCGAEDPNEHERRRDRGPVVPVIRRS